MTHTQSFYLKLSLALLLSLGLSNLAHAACDCGSTGASSACSGRSLSVKVNSGSRSNIFVWDFESNGLPARCGQFANGDYWLAPAVNESEVTLNSVTQSGGIDVFLDENPVPERTGFLTYNYGNQVASENIATALPRSFSYATSLVAGIERDQKRSGNCGTRAILNGCIDSYNVVTVLTSVPENAGTTVLRPNVIRATKELMSLDDFDFSRLAKRNFFDGADPAGLEEIRRRWAHHLEILSMRDRNGDGFSEGGRAFRADLVTDDYAATVAQQWHNNLSILLSNDHSLDEITPALASMLTYGKDIYNHVYDLSGDRDRWFGAGAGQSIGRFPAAVFFAAMAKNTKFADTLKLASTTQNGIGGLSVHEIDQVNIGPNGPVWGDGDDSAQHNTQLIGRYWGEMLIGQEFNGAQHPELGKKTGQRTMRDPYRLIDGPGQFPGVSYASVTAGPIRALAAEMILMPHMCEIVNYDAIVEYSLRITTHGRLIDNDLCAPPDPRELTRDIVKAMQQANVPGANNLLHCDTFRAKNCRYYGLNWDPNFTDAPTWGPNPSNRNLCIMNGIDPMTNQQQTGRFTNASLEDRAFDIGYRVLPIESNWAAITDGVSSCRTPSSSAPKPPMNVQLFER